MDSDGMFVFFISIAIFLSGILFGWIFTSEAYFGDYKNGQIDALTGKIKYELVTHTDKTSTWEKIKGE